MIASALAAQARPLIADELTMALDVSVQAQILDLAREVLERDSGLALILMPYELGVVADLADRVVLL